MSGTNSSNSKLDFSKKKPVVQHYESEEGAGLGCEVKEQGIRISSLNLDLAKGMENGAKNKEIAKRVNWYTTNWPRYGTFDRSNYEKFRDQKIEEGSAKFVPNPSEEETREAIKTIYSKFGWTQEEVEHGQKLFQKEQLQIPGAEKLFTQAVIEFKKTRLYLRLRDLFQNADTKNIKKIVAFGLTGLTWLPGLELGLLKAHKQHAALIEIKNILESKLGKGCKIKTFAQDPCYKENDVRILKKYDITVVKCTIGHTIGFTEIDDTTLVIDFHCVFPLYAVIFEYTMPAAIFVEKNLKRQLAVEPTIRQPGETAFLEIEDGDGKFIVPNPKFMEKPTITFILENYNDTLMELHDLDCKAAEGPDENQYNGKDGWTNRGDFQTYLGYEPALYLLKDEVRNPPPAKEQ
ncbi:hypothetical protein GLAREA_11090 [Glarea lozoyensis ATCC 20868]|uniref:SRR1-like domain-containing protein n=1 Tax=Glarea lozoyensis (strain ATCC 20868 / MF5171) TaxID=1116229 RepID=S3DTX2_GLAL2|nr:uncharacterized protein GLAREA_11090 [Glarea lozoyensis ATCC 20868]EPE35391.1 hypothetical protein GLAREA_11090 [Glarea lozoyensis ATCC 20868]